MLAVVRLILLGFFVVLSGVFGLLFCLARPFHPNNTPIFAHLYGSMHRLLGVKLEIRVPDGLTEGGPYVYIANHQNTYDIFTLSRAMPPRSVSIGKKSLKWIPFFGQLYWLAGNILIDRKNTGRARGTIDQAAQAITERQISVLLFPEGTRSYGRGLLPFKTGAFRTALQANVPIVPICVSNLHGRIKLNRWNNGKVLIEMLPPIKVSDYSADNVRALVAHCHQQMQLKISALDHELAEQANR
ncbi:1-acylglycerol-3-phosphate O-acyltransferase [Pseudidiomarina terrestris]|uniref:1-acyl-sn-glycerol-3-phosphate acyltransferase n=1 Tax=Pseudidiomarina terrestris TaxID=2820060 RepID=A0AAW7QU75_9GAMM|nr:MULTISPECIES: 1-acylglycerol-3-phosphate O-acyltransferase [unclassified Pseudidiomarina]MDN7123821.1 1-acylglycerol-3-phosphate O-acyltransferase [Pseudidiomarina sp. 1APP75-32.1]MDN7127575.1 1-acylglycerol-3-phosphate O-acyltransferase [Pseudidiomarina sp. 1APR75-33.1]MDN7136244.1 1-acylglycerol-3-phosphate O-acyltransferase [Pseudidiomarina sp. 1ASP75-5]MDN7138839.1 1-acylglycerol-3-phosphate O-acyltransferase [Pseudidiomarina sp. 1ASP75-14]MEA3588698.1 1-acylglycerol-3-phosphate O-acylt